MEYERERNAESGRPNSMYWPGMNSQEHSPVVTGISVLEHVRRRVLDQRDSERHKAVRMRGGSGCVKQIVTREQIVLHCVTDQRPPLQGQGALNRGKLNCVCQAGVGACGAAGHTVQRVDYHRLLALEVEAMNQPAAAGDAGATTNAGLLDNAGISRDLVTWQAVPGFGELWIGHVQASWRRCCWIHATNWAVGTTPDRRATSAPPLNKINVGMLRML